MEFEENLGEHYKRFLFALESANLELTDATKVTSRGIYSYRSPNRSFGNKVLTKLKAVFGLNPYYIRDGIGEPLLPNAPELIYRYKNNVPVNEPVNLYPNINFRNIEDLPENVTNGRFAEK